MLRNAKTFIVNAVAIVFLLQSSTPVRSEEVNVSYATYTAAYMDHLVALERGYFAEEELSLKRVTMGGGVATQTLVAGKLDFSSSGSSAISAAIRGGPVKVVYTNLSRPNYKVLTNKPEIQTVQDLVGKKVAVNTFGDTGHLAMLLLLKKHHVDPKSVLFIAVRSNDAKLPAFLAGAVDAAPLTSGEITKIGPDKGRMLVNLATEIQMVYTGVAVSDQFFADKPKTVERFLRGLAKGREYARRFKDPTITILTKYSPLPKEALALDYDVVINGMTDEGWVGAETLKEEVKTRAEIIKAKQFPDWTSIFDYSLIKKAYAGLKQEGWKPTR